MSREKTARFSPPFFHENNSCQILLTNHFLTYKELNTDLGFFGSQGPQCFASNVQETGFFRLQSSFSGSFRSLRWCNVRFFEVGCKRNCQILKKNGWIGLEWFGQFKPIDAKRNLLFVLCWISAFWFHEWSKEWVLNFNVLHQGIKVSLSEVDLRHSVSRAVWNWIQENLYYIHYAFWNCGKEFQWQNRKRKIPGNENGSN